MTTAAAWWMRGSNPAWHSQRRGLGRSKDYKFVSNKFEIMWHMFVMPSKISLIRVMCFRTPLGQRGTANGERGECI